MKACCLSSDVGCRGTELGVASSTPKHPDRSGPRDGRKQRAPEPPPSSSNMGPGGAFRSQLSGEPMAEPPEHPDAHLSTHSCTQAPTHAPKHHHSAPVGSHGTAPWAGQRLGSPKQSTPDGRAGAFLAASWFCHLPPKPALPNDGFHPPELNECGCLTACLQKGGALRRDLL